MAAEALEVRILGIRVNDAGRRFFAMEGTAAFEQIAGALKGCVAAHDLFDGVCLFQLK